MADHRHGRDFGCEHCWPGDADAAWEARTALRCSEELIDESHFHVMILACPRCDQRFISVFTETVDWADSEDPQAWAVMPLTGPEAAGLVQPLNALPEAQLYSIGPERRCLRRDFPKGALPRAYWGTGMAVGAHD